MRLSVVIIILLSLFTCGKLFGQVNTITCTNGGVYDIVEGEEVKCVFSINRYIYTVNCNNNDLDVISSNLGNSPQEVTIKIAKQGRFTVKFDFAYWNSLWQSESATITFNVRSKEYFAPKLSAIIKKSDCSGKTGSIDLSIQNLDTYITFDGNSTVSIGGFSYVQERDFTIEGRVRVREDDNSFRNRGYISLFGQDNTVEFGFINGRIAFYVATTDGGRPTYRDGGEYPNDGQWHHVAIRGNGQQIEVLIDGVNAGTLPITYSQLEVDNAGSENPVLIGDGVWGHDNEAFKGDISRLAFWGKYLDDSDFANLDLVNAEWISGEATGLIAAYNIDKKDGNNLIAETPEGTLDDCTGQLSAPDNQWEFWVNSYSWKDGKGTTISTDQDIFNLAPGDYAVTVNYSHKEVNKNIEDIFRVGLDEKLSVNVTISENQSVCEGDELTLETNITGGVNDNTEYIWEIFTPGNSEDKKIIVGTDKKFRAPIEFDGSKLVRLKVDTKFCTEESPQKPLIIHKKIKTNPIFHKKEKKP